MNGWMNFAMAALVVVLASPPLIGGAAPDSLAAARELYAAAEYEDALKMLDRLGAPKDQLEMRAAGQVRAYCLLALGRSADADEAIAVAVAADPAYRPSPDDASPRIRAAFSDVRRRLLPGILQRQYLVAKAQFDAKDFGTARDTFTALLQAFADPDLASVAAQPPLADLHSLAAGFRELSAAAAVPPPIAARQQPIAMNAGTLAPKTYDAEDTQVTAPVVLRQTLPPFKIQGVPPPAGLLVLVVDEAGDVIEASMMRSITARYDQQLINAARDWKYSPATLNGRPVKYRKVVQVSIQE